MKPNLDTLKTEIEQYLEESGLAVFYGYSRAMESTPAVLTMQPRSARFP